MAYALDALHLANVGTRLRVTFERGGEIIRGTVVEVLDDGVRLRYDDGSVGYLRDADYVNDKKEALSRSET